VVPVLVRPPPITDTRDALWNLDRRRRAPATGEAGGSSCPWSTCIGARSYSSRLNDPW